jgi:hypothetical protein
MSISAQTLEDLCKKWYRQNEILSTVAVDTETSAAERRGQTKAREKCMEELRILITLFGD